MDEAIAPMRAQSEVALAKVAQAKVALEIFRLVLVYGCALALIAAEKVLPA